MVITAAALLKWVGLVKAALEASGIAGLAAEHIQEHLGDLAKLFKAGTPPAEALEWLQERVLSGDMGVLQEDESKDTVKLTIKTTPGAIGRLSELHETGLCGGTIEETAERAMCATINLMLSDGAYPFSDANREGPQEDVEDEA